MKDKRIIMSKAQMKELLLDKNERILELEAKVLSLEQDLDVFLIQAENIGALYGMIRDVGEYIANKEGVSLGTVADFTIRDARSGTSIHPKWKQTHIQNAGLGK